MEPHEPLQRSHVARYVQNAGSTLAVGYALYYLDALGVCSGGPQAWDDSVSYAVLYVDDGDVRRFAPRKVWEASSGRDAGGDIHGHNRLALVRVPVEDGQLAEGDAPVPKPTHLFGLHDRGADARY